MAAAGIGTLGIVDADLGDASNLQRQILHDTQGIGTPKTASARRHLTALNPHVAVETFQLRLSSENAREIVRQFDIVVDGSDNFPTRYLVNDACVLERRPLVYGSIFRFEGQLSPFAVPGGPCYRCLFADPPPPELVPSCVEAGVLGVLPGLVGTLQALETIKWVLGLGRSAAGRLILVDALALKVREVAVQKDPECAICGTHPTVTELVDYEAFCGMSPVDTPDTEVTVSPQQLRNALATATPPVVLDVREDWEFAVAHLSGSILVPLGELPGRLREIPTDREVITVCHKGMRSMTARALLRRAGFPRVRSLDGGIDAWAEIVDWGMRRY